MKTANRNWIVVGNLYRFFQMERSNRETGKGNQAWRSRGERMGFVNVAITTWNKIR